MKFLSLLLALFTLTYPGASGAAAFVSGNYEIVKSNGPGCPEGQFGEVSSDGKTLLSLGGRHTIQIRPKNDREEVEGGCLYVTSTEIKDGTLTHTSLRSNCPEAGHSIEMLKKIDAESLEYTFTDQSGKKSINCLLKKTKAKGKK